MKAKKFLGGINEYSVRLHKMRKEGQYMSYYSVNLPRYTIGEGCYREIPEKARFLGKTAVVIGGKTAMSKAKEKLLEGVKDSDVLVRRRFYIRKRECSDGAGCGEAGRYDFCRWRRTCL